MLQGRWTGTGVWFESDSVTQVQQPLKSFQTFSWNSSQHFLVQHYSNRGTFYSRIHLSSRHPTSGELLGNNNRIRKNLQLKVEESYGVQGGWKKNNLWNNWGNHHLGFFYRSSKTLFNWYI